MRHTAALSPRSTCLNLWGWQSSGPGVFKHEMVYMSLIYGMHTRRLVARVHVLKSGADQGGEGLKSQKVDTVEAHELCLPCR